MRYFLTFFIAFTVLSGLLFSGCSDDDYSTGKGGLSFSQDTLSFDTIFSGVGSTTAWLKVRNTHNQPVTITNVKLKSGGETGFRINLDGENGKEFNNVVIPAHDSLFLFIAITAPTRNSDKPVFLEDAVLFETEYGSQQIVLEAWSWDAVIWRGKTISSDTILTSIKPYIIYDSLVVAKNATLTILDGVTFYMHDASRIVVRGVVKAKGSQFAPVTFRGDRLDYVIPDLPYDFYPAQWHFIELANTSFNNVFDYVHIRGGYYGLIADSSSIEETKFTMTNSVVHNSYYSCLWSFNNQFSVANSEFTNSGSYTVCVVGGKAVFTHCSIANYMSYNINFVTRDGPTLVLANYTVDSLKNEHPWPLSSAFRNCIVYGSAVEELGFGISSNKNILSDISFVNCMLKTKTDLTGLAVDCIYPQKPGFLKLGADSVKYVFDFRIDSVSPARGKASRTFSALYPYDMNGVSRNDADGPDIGAYEFR
jgi:hypothetical protein